MKTKWLYLLAALVAIAGVFALISFSDSPVRPPAPPTASTTQIKPPQPSFTDEAATPTPTPTREDISKGLLERIQVELTSDRDPDANTVLKSLLAELVKNDPAAATHLAESLAPGSLQKMVMRCIAQDWAMQDPAGAENWADQLRDPDERLTMLSDVCYQIAQTNPEQAIRAAEQVELKGQKYPVLQDLAQQWAVKDYPSAYAWVMQQPANEERDQLLTRMVFVQSQTDPESAAKIVVQQISPGPAQTEAAITVVYQWAKNDLPGATAWVESFPPGPLRQRAENELAGIAASQKQ